MSTTRPRPFLSVLLPALNEAATVEQIIEEVLEVPEDLELILVDDGSSDGTGEIMDRHADGDRVRVIHHRTPQGKGAAVRTALDYARGDYVLIQDADLEYSPGEIPQLLEPVHSGRASVVFGLRTFAAHSAFSFWYVVGNRAIATATNIIYNSFVRDPLSCYKILPRPLAIDLDLRSRGFEIDAEIAAKLLRRRVRIYEVPVSYAARSRDEGKKVTAADGIRAIRTLLRHRLRSERRRAVSDRAGAPRRRHTETTASDGRQEASAGRRRSGAYNARDDQPGR